MTSKTKFGFGIISWCDENANLGGNHTFHTGTSCYHKEPQGI
jgi:hypothetical protein